MWALQVSTWPPPPTSLPLTHSAPATQPPHSTNTLQAPSCLRAFAQAVPCISMTGAQAPTLKHNKLPRWAGPRDCQARAGRLGGWEGRRRSRPRDAVPMETGTKNCCPSHANTWAELLPLGRLGGLGRRWWVSAQTSWRGASQGLTPRSDGGRGP